MARPALVWFGLLLSSVAFAADAPQQECRTYDPDPQHLWNRLHEALFIRAGPDGARHGHDRIDPLFWPSTQHLLAEGSHRKALGVLDEFLDERGEKLIRDPLRRAFLQHDLWALFDWSARPPGGEQYSRQRQELQPRLATIMRRLALTQSELASLPDNYVRAQANSTLAELPRSLLQADGEWVNVGLRGGFEVAPTHLAGFGGRSVFRILLRLPAGRSAAVSYLEQLRSFERPWILVKSREENRELPVANPALPQLPAGTQWALVRLMCVIDSNARIQPTPVVESIQVRRDLAISPGIAERGNAQQFFKFVASRGQNGNLREVPRGELDFFQFRSHDTDPFELTEAGLASLGADGFRRHMQTDVLRGCRGCHGGLGIHAVLSRDRSVFGPYLPHSPELIDSEPETESAATVRWKHRQYDFGLLQGLWERTN